MKTVRLPSFRLRVPTMRTLRETVLVLGGFGALDFAAWHAWGVAAGSACIGASLLVINYLTQPEAS